MSHDSVRPAALEWGIKQSLVEYVLGMKDGSVAVDAPAQIAPGGFVFPAAGAGGEAGSAGAAPDGHRFDGAVTLTGHGGMLHLAFADIALEPCAAPGTRWTLTIADPYETGARLPFASIERLETDADGNLTAHGTRLTSDGADLFMAGPYTEGVEFDDPRVTAARS